MAKGLIQEEKKKFRKVSPVGYLYVSGAKYFLLNLKPIKPDWENENERRFAAVPCFDVMGWENDTEVYSFARHVVSNAFTIEYNPNIAPILVWDLGDIDLSAIEEEEQKDCEDEEPDWHQLELTDMIRSMEESNG